MKQEDIWQIGCVRDYLLEEGFKQDLEALLDNVLLFAIRQIKPRNRQDDDKKYSAYRWYARGEKL